MLYVHWDEERGSYQDLRSGPDLMSNIFLVPFLSPAFLTPKSPIFLWLPSALSQLVLFSFVPGFLLFLLFLPPASLASFSVAMLKRSTWKPNQPKLCWLSVKKKNKSRPVHSTFEACIKVFGHIKLWSQYHRELPSNCFASPRYWSKWEMTRD